jgi:hypothetical protein
MRAELRREAEGKMAEEERVRGVRKWGGEGWRVCERCECAWCELTWPPICLLRRADESRGPPLLLTA